MSKPLIIFAQTTSNPKHLLSLCARALRYCSPRQRPARSMFICPSHLLSISTQQQHQPLVSNNKQPSLTSIKPQQKRASRMATTTPAAASSTPSADDYNQRWVSIWNAGLQKGQQFDKGHCSPQLLHLLDTGSLAVKGKKTLVPGCGRGYDVFAFAAAGAAVSVGLDLVPEAVAAAQQEQQRQLGDNPTAAAAVHLTTGDFFTFRSSEGYKGPFDFGYDYTFLCALRPDMRQDWANTWSRLLAPGGELLTMVYPVDASRDQNQGPPWPVTPELYKQLLIPAGFELVSLEPIPHSLSHESRSGLEWLGRWINKKELTTGSSS